MIIRKVEKKDLEEILRKENSCFKKPYSYQQLEYEFERNPVNMILVAEEDSKIIGFIDFMITFNSATITQIAVVPEQRRKGIACTLLNAMEQVFPKNIDDVVETVTLEVRESNVPAINLYKRNGYEFVVIKPKYYPDGENAIYMVKRLLLCR